MDRLNVLWEKIALLRKTAEELQDASDEFPALKRNTGRILASIRMLEINLPREVFK